MDLSKYSKKELLDKCEELGIEKCKSKNKSILIELINNKIKIEDDNINDLEKNKEDIIKKEIDELTIENIITDNISLYYGDCIVEMNKIEDDSINLILCDLPYGTTKCKWDTIIDLNELWKHYKRIIKKPSGVILLFDQQHSQVC